MSAARIALLANGLFVVLLIAVHVLKPDLDPSWRFISEYAVGKYGWLMQAAFLSLAAANVATYAAIRTELRTAWGRVGSFLFLAGSVGVVLGGLFVTDPVNTPPDRQTTSGMLHNLGGGLGLLGFLGTLVLGARLLRSETWRPARTAVAVATAVVVLGFLISFFSIAIIATMHAGVFSPDTPVGWPNRLGILSGCAWLAIIAWRAERMGRTANPTASENA